MRIEFDLCRDHRGREPESCGEMADLAVQSCASPRCPSSESSPGTITDSRCSFSGGSIAVESTYVIKLAGTEAPGHPGGFSRALLGSLLLPV